MRRASFPIALSVALASQALTAPQTYNFTIDSAASSLQANVLGQAAASGSLIGNFNASTNTGGTRTKPGLTGAFGETENVAVSLAGASTWKNEVKASMVGGMSFKVDTATKVIQMTGYNVQFTSAATPTPKGSFTPTTSAFRTKVPTFAYPAFTDTLNFNGPRVTSFKVVQTSSVGSGVMKLESGSTYSFTIIYSAQVSGTITANSVSQPFSVYIPMIFRGRVTINGNSASLTSTTGQNGKAIALAQPFTIPTFAAALPTGGAPANVLCNIKLSTATFSFDKEANLFATGVLVG